MTAEICVMNRLAVVLAADSATTVSQYTDTGKQERYFKGANKIFQLSDHHPVGIMIFSSANILNVPWELVIKEFRRGLKDKSFNELSGYADEFFKFLEEAGYLFPEDSKRETFLRAAQGVAVRVFLDAMEHARSHLQELEADVAVSDAQRRDAWVTASARSIQALTDEIAKIDYPEGVDDAAISDLYAQLKEPLIGAIAGWRDSPFAEAIPSDLGEIAEMAILAVAKKCEQLLGDTGIVFAGYGDHDMFPSMLEYRSCGFVGIKHVVLRRRRIKIDHKTPANLEAFAQTSMSDTFTIGLSLDLFVNVRDAAQKRLRKFAEELCARGGFDLSVVADLDQLISQAQDEIGGEVLKRSQKDHGEPMRKVLSVLPIDEMAELAETLINLQSLKEKVTKPSETVGGPVDVAVITRHEGLVWIKRKHYFDPALNSRFALRQANQHH